jgi:4-hydroxyphenylpyruvate dioxygenase-like putative hemolysin
MAMSDELERLDSEIARLQAEAASIERAPRTIAERYAETEARLREAEGVYRQWGFDASAGHPGEAQHVQRQSLIGALMVVNSAALLKAERQRIEAQGEGLTAAEKARRLDQLRAAILRASANRELLVRATEGDGEFQPRVIHLELAIYTQAAVERLAAG